MVDVHPLGQSVTNWSALSDTLLVVVLGVLVVVWGCIEFRRPQLVPRLSPTSTVMRTRLYGFGLDFRRACGLLAMFIGTGIALFGFVPTEIDLALAAAFCATSALVVLWYGALTA